MSKTWYPSFIMHALTSQMALQKFSSNVSKRRTTNQLLTPPAHLASSPLQPPPTYNLPQRLSSAENMGRNNLPPLLFVPQCTGYIIKYHSNFHGCFGCGHEHHTFCQCPQCNDKNTLALFHKEFKLCKPFWTKCKVNSLTQFLQEHFIKAKHASTTACSEAVYISPAFPVQNSAHPTL